MQLRESVYEPGSHQAAHAHDYMSLSFVARGGLEESVGGVRRTAAAGDVIVKPAGVVHEDVYGPGGTKMFTIVLDEEIGPYRWLFGGAPAALFTRAIVECRDGAPIEDLAFDLVAAVLECGSNASAFQSARSKSGASALQVAEHDVPVAALAREVAMHPVSLARAFRREHGMSITCYRRRARVRRATTLLTTSAMPLAEVALESGFTDQSHFCRIFKTEMGVTPSAFRALAV